MSAVLPFILALAITLRRRAWDESRLRPLLIVFWVTTVDARDRRPASLTTAFEGVDWSIQRYVEYSLPLLYVLVVAGIWQGLVAARLVALVTGVVAARAAADAADPEHPGAARDLRAHPPRRPAARRSRPGVAMALIAVLVGGVVAARDAQRRARRASRCSRRSSCSRGAVFAVQNQAGWNWQREQSQVWRDGFPDDLSWIDDATDRRDLARLVTFYNSYRTPQTEFFNRRDQPDLRDARASTPGGAPVNGFTCEWTIGPNGTLTFGPACGPPPTAFYLNDDISKPTFYDQRVIAEKPDIGRDRRGQRRRRGSRRSSTRRAWRPSRRRTLKTGEINAAGPSPAREGTAGRLLPRRPGQARAPLPGRAGRTRSSRCRATWEQTPRLVTLPAGNGDRHHAARRPRARASGRSAFDWKGRPPQFPELDVREAHRRAATTTELLY